MYLSFFRYDTSDFIPCEICDGPSNDIHHINARGMGGDPQGKKDVIENLMALCRTCHNKYGDKVQYKHFLNEVHAHHIQKSIERAEGAQLP